MKRLSLVTMLVLVSILAIVSLAIAADDGIILKQSQFYTWEDAQAKNATTVTILKTDASIEPIASMPKWVKAVLDGWCFDAGAAYEDETIKDGCLLVGRDFGTLGKYFPWLVFPFKDRIQISIYPAGVFLPDVVHHLAPKGCSGIGYIKGTLKF